MFRFSIEERLHRRGESQNYSVPKLFSSVKSTRGEFSYISVILTADRGYGKYRIMDILDRHGYSSIFVMADHPISVHPFEGSSHFNLGMDELLEEDEGGETIFTVEEGDGAESTVLECIAELENRQLRKFIVLDGGKLGLALFIVSYRRAGRFSKLRALAVREPKRKSVAKIVRFIYDLPNIYIKDLEKWIGKLLSGVDDSDLFIQEGNSSLRSRTRNELKKHGPLTRGQRCVDWFVLRRFRVTATLGAVIPT